MSETAPIAPVRPRIVVDKTQGRDGNDFFHCFFLENDAGLYDFFNQRGDLLHSDVQTGREFKVHINGVHFLVFRFHIDETAAHGHFIPLDAQTGEEPEPEGSFQASSGGGLEESYADDVSEDPPAGAIEINTVTGNSDKDKLKKCYFMAVGTTYTLYSKNGNVLASGLTSGTGFTFTHDSITWTITNFVISSTAASGNWSDPNPPITGEQDGTFTASSGGTAEGEAASVAKA
jgi:hypothetical protein